jgi:hypothetical protein
MDRIVAGAAENDIVAVGPVIVSSPPMVEEVVSILAMEIGCTEKGGFT